MHQPLFPRLGEVCRGHGSSVITRVLRTAEAKLTFPAWAETDFAARMSDEPKEKLEKFGAVSGFEQMSVLQAFDRMVASLPPRDPLRPELFAVRAGVADQEEMIGDARQMIEKLEEVIRKVTSPANRIGTYLGSPARDTAHIVVGGRIITATSIRGSNCVS